jgi:hypothetical protein
MFMFLNLLHTFISSSGAKFSVRCHGRVVQFDPGYLSLTSAHIPNPSKEVAFENAYILIYEKQIGSKAGTAPGT